MNINNGYTINVLDNIGYVRYIDHMGSDQRIVEAARISYKSPSKGYDSDKKLIHYLYKNMHCYHDEMEVLTNTGWKKWKDCNPNGEFFMIPDPISKNIFPEFCKLETFDCEEDLITFDNNRMSFAVTSEHRMWFKGKYEKKFTIKKIGEISKWGHFEPLFGYTIKDDKLLSDDMFELIGFYLGDGNLSSDITASFHLKKPRKINRIKELCEILNIKYWINSQKDNTVILNFHYPTEFKNWVDLELKTKDKKLKVSIDNLSCYQKRGLFSGLVNSDGSFKKDRPQIEYSSVSLYLANLFMNLAIFLGYDAHFVSSNKSIYSAKAYNSKGRTSLESRSKYWSTKSYKGKVYCATTSTGLLIVRGKNNEFAFICGNTSPFEMVKVTLNIKMPIFIMRQYSRHRMQNLNEVSARYTELPDEFYIPKTWREQDTVNKQGSIISSTNTNFNPVLYTWTESHGHGGNQSMDITATKALQDHCDSSYRLYKSLISKGISREMARMVLPVNIYTEIYACWDLKNLLHFITLREDSHAQAEIQEYATAIKNILKEICPITMECYEKYKFKLV